MFGRGKVKIPLSMADENKSLRERVATLENSSKNQGKTEKAQLKLAQRQLGEQQRQNRKERRQNAIRTGRKFIERTASKPITQSKANRMMFGADSLKNQNPGITLGQKKQPNHANQNRGIFGRDGYNRY